MRAWMRASVLSTCWWFLLTRTTSAAWRTHLGSIYFGNESAGPVALKGVNWFGFESACKVPHGLWVRPVDDLFDLMQDYQYNLVRLTFAKETIDDLDQPANPLCLEANAWMIDMSVRSIIDMFFQKAAERNIAVLLAYHSIGGQITQTPLVDGFDAAAFYQLWSTVIQSFSQHDNWMGIDIKNEPHGTISWTEWSEFSQQFIVQTLRQHPEYNGIFFVEGVESYGSVWGGSFPQGTDLSIFPSDRTVFSPHLYGVSIRGAEAMHETFALYDSWFGWIQHQHRPIVIGEFGGWFVGDDYTWQKRAAVYLKKRNLCNLIYWSFNPDSQDTGGLLQQDWNTVLEPKIALQEFIQPDPTAFSFSVGNE